MKKWFKKIITGVAVVAMAISLLPAMNVKAATNVKLYFKLPSGWEAATTGYNYWGTGAQVSGSGSTVNKPTEWGEGTLGQVYDESNGWVSVVVNDTSKMEGIQLTNSSAAKAYNDNANLWNAEINSLGLTSAYFNTTTNKWYKEQACSNEVLPPTLDDIFYVTGDEGLTGAAWGATPAGGLMTEGSNGVFTKEFTVATAGTYSYKILQDPADFGWDNPYTAESNGSIAGGNGSVTTTVDGSTVKFSIDKTTHIVTVDVSAPQNSSNTNDTNNNNSGSTGNTTNETEETVQPDVPAVKEEATSTAKVYIYAKTDASWGDEVYLYAWQNDADANYPNEGAWPGNKMERMGNGWYRLAITEKSDRVIINNGKDKAQTQDITITAGKSHAFTVAADGKYEASELPKMGDVNAVPYVVALLVGMGVVGVAIARKRRVA